MTFLTHLESTADGSHLAADVVQTVHGGRPLLARYDLARVRGAVRRDDLATRPPSLWRYRDLEVPLRGCKVCEPSGSAPRGDRLALVREPFTGRRGRTRVETSERGLPQRG